MNLFASGSGPTGAGKGVEKDERKKRPIFICIELYGRKFLKYMYLNMLYFLCCLPVVTIGPATAGMTYVIRNYTQEEHAWLVGDFFHAFKENFWKSLLNSIIVLVAYVVIFAGLDFYFQYWMGGNISLTQWVLFGILLSLCLFALVIFTFMQFYVNLMIVTFDLKLFTIYKNALILAVAKFGQNLMIFIVCAVVWLVPFLALYTATYWGVVLAFALVLLICFSLTGYIVDFWCYRTIDTLMIQGNKQKD